MHDKIKFLSTIDLKDFTEFGRVNSICKKMLVVKLWQITSTSPFFVNFHDFHSIAYGFMFTCVSTGANKSSWLIPIITYMVKGMASYLWQ